jgi:hypothetical protein
VVVIAEVTVIMKFDVFYPCRFFLGQKVKAINSSETRGITTQKTVPRVNFVQEEIMSIKSLEEFLIRDIAAFRKEIR